MVSEKPVRILLVDDDEDDFVLTREILYDIEQFDFELKWAKNATSGLELIRTNEFDICFVDYLLGKSDGISLITEAVGNGVETPMVLLTGKGNLAIDRLAMEKGAADFLVKTELTPELMERSIRYALKHSNALSMVKEGEQRFRQLFERSMDSIFISDLDHKLIDINPAFVKLIGGNYEDIITRSLSDYFKNESDFQQFGFYLKSKEQVKEYLALIVGYEGTIECNISCVKHTDHNGDFIGYQGIIRDMTMQKKAELDMLVAERLSMTGKIARSIAHEVRNPLTNLGLALGQLEEELPKDNEDISMFIGIIDRNAKRIGQLITEMLNSSKPRELHRVEYNINILLEEVIDLVRDRITLKVMQLDKHLDKSIDTISVDADKLKMAILNVMVNAIEAMEEGQGVLSVQSVKRKDLVQIFIKDNGCGIPEDKISTLFDPFFTNKQGGMGLGLTSTQNIINSHKGSIDVESVENQGTTFIISLPG
ncbi:ATP-binding protein [Fulvivirga sp.]|uniref:hybrid sensor histidine kinase/response regulator n=1 Tax=Fulvivirga sp. TaxID=1931237 RepID=UPI0032EDACC1